LKQTPSRWEIRFIDPSKLEPNPFFHRENLEKPMDEAFIESATQDLKQEIIVRRKPGSKRKYQIAFGHRRAQAFRLRELPVPSRIRPLSDEEMVDYAFDDAFQREDHSPREETQLIVAKLDMKFRHHPQEYEKYARDPLVVLRSMEHQRTHGEQIPRKSRTGKYPVPKALWKTVEKVFSELPERRRISWTTFVREYVALLDVPADVQEAIDAKGIPASVGVMTAIASVQDSFSRTHMLNWAKRRKHIPVHIADERVKALNHNAKLLGQVKNGSEKKKVIEVALEKGLSPKKFELELKRLLPKPKDVNAPIENHDDMIQVYCPADSADMSQVEDDSVRLIVTSPPYGGKIGFEGDYLSKAKTPEEFFSQVEPIMEECFRVLAPGGKLVINWADPIGKWGNEETVENGEYAEHIYAHRWVELAERVGFKLWARQIWHKNVYYSIAQRRVRWEDALRADGKTHLDWEWILTFRKPGPAPEGNTGLPYEKWTEYSKGVWYIPGAQDERGLATFPEELVSRLIQLYSFEGDLVLDPFLGAGTTLAVAKSLGRRGVGYEINPDLKGTITAKLSSDSAKAEAE
jgi:DNA modification methylase